MTLVGAIGIAAWGVSRSARVAGYVVFGSAEYPSIGGVPFV
jgi:hypothetical protein